MTRTRLILASIATSPKWRPGVSPVEYAGKHLEYFTGVQIHEQGVIADAHPLVPVRRRRKPERLPVVDVVVADQEDRRQHLVRPPTHDAIAARPAVGRGAEAPRP